MAKELWKLPTPSTGFMHGPRVIHDGVNVELYYEFIAQTGKYDWGVIAFERVFQFEFIYLDYCSNEQIRAYDKVVEVTDSIWAKKNIDIENKKVPLRHYRIFFDELGCYEFVAIGFHSVWTPRAKDLPHDE